MASASTYLQTAVLNAVFRNIAFPTITQTYLSLHTDDPGLTGVNELTASAINYVRVAATPTVWDAPSSGSSSTNAAVTFPTAGSPWGVITWVGVWDSLSGGNFLLKGLLLSSRTVSTGDVFEFTVGNLTGTVA